MPVTAHWLNHCWRCCDPAVRCVVDRDVCGTAYLQNHFLRLAATMDRQNNYRLQFVHDHSHIDHHDCRSGQSKLWTCKCYPDSNRSQMVQTKWHFALLLQRNHYLMLPWVVLGAMLVVGLLISVIYNGVKFIIDGYLITALVWFILGLLCCGKYLCFVHSIHISFCLDLNDMKINDISSPISISVVYAYMWCVVYSHFTVLREESKRGKYNRQPYRR